MNATVVTKDRKRLEQELAVYVGVIHAYKNLIMLDEPEARQLIYKLGSAHGLALRNAQRLEKVIAKMDVGKK